ncbi:serine hydrolase [Knoellia sp. p5-6-4]|uniref:serine hydrolase domain-containing protein n=1 Tax=unclassified Knoellia TaxID=2618719 RepID=UPI0023DADEEC|nr:serine hydrolase domain-containing protein [Knoellia sp. p5-6-4]MDF2145944.1 serine hydrolase [Knoellia sp. p5-6-4]
MAELGAGEIAEQVALILNRSPAVGLAVGVVRSGELPFFHGHGVAEVSSRTPVTPETVFRVGSLTKTFTAVAVMQLWERGKVDLDAPAEDYLRSYRLVPTKPAFSPVTMRHLMTHTAGIREVLHPSGVLRPLFGETVKSGHSVPSLAKYYRHGVRVEAEPGTRFRYTDHGFATLGQIVEDVTGEPLDRYLREHVFAPLGMVDTTLIRSGRITPRLATGYVMGSRGPRAVPDYEVVTAAAAAAYSTSADIARYVEALLGGGANVHGRVLQPATLSSMFAPQYQPDPRIPGLGLAFFRGTVAGTQVIEHQGIVPGFNAEIFLAPHDGVGVMALTNGSPGATMWMPVEMGRLLGFLLRVQAEEMRTDVPQHPEVWNEVCGWYSLSGPLTDVRARGALGAGVEVFVRRGRLMLRSISAIPGLYRGLPLHPDDAEDPYVFRLQVSEEGFGVRVVFSRAPGGGATAVHLDVMPLSALRRRRATDPRRWLRAAGGAAGLSLVATTLRRSRRRLSRS